MCNRMYFALYLKGQIRCKQNVCKHNLVMKIIYKYMCVHKHVYTCKYALILSEKSYIYVHTHACMHTYIVYNNTLP